MDYKNNDPFVFVAKCVLIGMTYESSPAVYQSVCEDIEMYERHFNPNIITLDINQT
jgi:hypothetical protein